jgi:hypothetical protein
VVEGSASRPGRSLPPGKTRYPLYRRLGGPQGRSGTGAEYLAPPEFDPRNVQPVASRYIDCAIRPTMAYSTVKISRFGGTNCLYIQLKEVDLPITSKAVFTLAALRTRNLANRSCLTDNRVHPHSNRSPWYRHDALTPAHSYKHDRLALVSLNLYQSVGGLLLLLRKVTGRLFSSQWNQMISFNTKLWPCF